MAVSLGGANRKPGMALGLSWDHGKRTRTAALAVALLVAVALTLPTPSLAAATPSPLVPVIVREVPGSGEAAENLVEEFGGRVGDRLQIISGFAAEIPQAMISPLTADPAVFSVTPDTKVRLLDFGSEFATETTDTLTRGSYVDDAYNDDDATDLELVQADTTLTTTAQFGDSIALSPSSTLSLFPTATSSLTTASQTAPPGWMALVNDATGAMDFWAKGFTGSGVDVRVDRFRH